MKKLTTHVTQLNETFPQQGRSSHLRLLAFPKTL